MPPHPLSLYVGQTRPRPDHLPFGLGPALSLPVRELWPCADPESREAVKLEVGEVVMHGFLQSYGGGRKVWGRGTKAWERKKGHAGSEHRIHPHNQCTSMARAHKPPATSMQV